MVLKKRLVAAAGMLAAICGVMAQSRGADAFYRSQGERLYGSGASEYSSLVRLVGNSSGADKGSGDEVLSTLEALSAEMAVSNMLSFLSRAYEGDSHTFDGFSPTSAEGEAAFYSSLRLPSMHHLTSGFYRPVPGIVTSPFGYRPRFRRMHKGIDLRLNTGDTVRAAFPGVVRATGYEKKGYGYYVIVRHAEDMETLYAHLQGPVARMGDIVNAGDAIATGGSTGHTTGPHLHFELRVNGYAVDPSELFDFRIPTRGEGISRATLMAALDAAASFMPTAEEEALSGALQLRPGAEIPAVYTVKKGDSVYSLARRFSMPEGTICRLNNIKPYAILFSGQKLRLR